MSDIRAIIISYLVRSGQPVSPDWKGSVYGWIDPGYAETRKHFEDCGLDMEKCSYEDSYWAEFGGTFAEHDDERKGLDAVVTCRCGKLADRHFRYSDSYAELIRGITDE